MFLKRMETVGFKSFAERTTIEFVPGVTAVVGPNGSGKSNVIDAIRWVLGEQSAKSLRGQKMEDVIFQGSDTRKRLNYAEVSLVMNNEAGILPVDFQEVYVTRRVYRSGESEFYINKQACRLKDIVDLFMDTGLGRESFSIIGQGKIDEILSSKAEERRAIFEEAAGVLKYKRRKNQAELKLAETADNLDRVEDIIHEIETQIEPLQEQAKVATQYQTERQALQHIEISLLVTEIDALHAKWQAVLAEIESDRFTEVKEKTTIQEKEAHIIHVKQQIGTLDKQINGLQTELLQYTEKIEQLEGKRNVHLERIHHVKENKQKLITDQKQTEIKINEIKADYDKEIALLSDITSVLSALQKEMAQLQQHEVDGPDKIKNQLEDLKSDYIEQLNAQAVLQNEKKSLYNERERMKQQATKKEQSRHTSTALFQALVKEKEKTAAQLTALANDMAKKTAQVASDKKTVTKYQQQLEEMHDELYKGNEQIAKWASRKEMLGEMKENFQGFFYGVKAILQAKKEKRLQQPIEGVVLDLMDVPAKYLTAIDTILGAQAQFIVVKTDTIAKEIIQWLKKENKGRATFLPLQSIETRVIPSHVRKAIENDAGYLGIASDLVYIEEKYKKVTEHLMGNVLVTDHLTSAIQLAKKTNRKYRIVTLEGDVIYPGGSMSGGAKKNTTPSLFAREKEIATLEDKLVQSMTRRDHFILTIEKKKEAIHDLKGKINHIETELQQLNREVQALQQKDHEQAVQLHTAENEMQLYNMEQARVQKEEKEILAHIQEKEQEIEMMEDMIAKTEQTIEEATKQEQDAQHHEKYIENKLHTLQIAITEQKERKKSHTAIKTKLQTELADLTEKNEMLHVQMEQLTKEAQSTITESELKEEISQHKTTRQQITTLLAKKQQERTNHLRVVADEENEVKGLYTHYNQFTKQVQNKEVQANRLDVALENRLSFLQSEYTITYEKAQSTYEKVKNIETARDKVKQIKLAIKKLGTVNLGAIEEYERVNERYTFLMAQQTDLIQAKQTLHDAIYEMDKEMTERFKVTFTEIQSSFSVVFKQLFGGGKAELKLTDPDNLLETGIEIIAMPPGKKPKMLGLLSGGERALTAIALLFSILRVRPVPFCILDEVDAALDEANVARFGSYLKTFSEQSQFIVITHRKGTMEEADALYGVTMQESGVSRLVSVKLAETKDLIEMT